MLRRLRKDDRGKREEIKEDRDEAVNILSPVEENVQIIQGNQDNIVIENNIRGNDNLENNIQNNFQNNPTDNIINNPSIENNLNSNQPNINNQPDQIVEEIKQEGQKAEMKPEEKSQGLDEKVTLLQPDKPKEKEENKLQKEFKNIFQGRDLFSINNYRKRLLHLTFFCIIFDMVILEILCLYLNICYGEVVEMQKWVSHSIVPLCVILLFLYIILYFSSDLITKVLISVTTIFIIIILIFFFGIGIFTLGFAAASKETDIQISWDLLSQQSKLYYYDNDINVLYKTYISKMMVTGVLYLVQAVLGIIVVCFSYRYYEKLTVDWRPPLRARLSDDRAQRYIELYAKFNKDYKRLYEMENFKADKDKLIDRVNEIIDEVPNLPVRNKNRNVVVNDQIVEPQNNIEMNRPEYTQIKKEEDVEENPNQNFIQNQQPPKKRNILKRRKKGEDDDE